MKDFAYQQDAINDLTQKVVGLLNEGGSRRKVVFEAPTGSGKTVMACQTLANIVDTLKSDGTNRYEDVAFIWFAPRKLHLQSYMKLKGAFADGRELRPVMFDDLEQSEGIQPGEILFVNWESVNKEKNLMVRESEANASLYEICRRTREQNGLPIVAIIDEEHMFWSKTADKSGAVLDRINPTVEIRISATPKTMRSDEKVRIGRDKVIAAEMIKREVVLNPELDSGITDETTLNNHLMKLALDKRDQLAEAYKKLGVNINPLLLIQLPNDQKETMTAEDNAIADFVRQYLEAMREITVENGRLAVWLAGEKSNLAGLEQPDNMAQVLLFKEAIALGWDCPRAAVLLIFRKLSSDQFTIQTVGRILRMPEQHHYTDDRLNIGYVYTDIAKDKIHIVTTDADYIKKYSLVAVRRPELNNVELKSVYADRPNDTRNYFGPDFRKILYEESERFWNIEQASGGLFSLAELAALRGDDDVPKPLPDTDDEQINENRRRVANTLRLDVPNVNIPIPKDIHFQNEVGTIDVDNRSVKFARTAAEIDRIYISEISKYVSSFESKNNPADKLAGYLLETIADFFGIFDTDAKKVFLYHENRSKFDRLLRTALERYIKIRQTKKQKASARAMKEFQWSVPEERLYEDETHRLQLADNHALQPFFELNTASSPEKEFVKFLEANSEYIDWWYKNGDKGRQHYAIEYTDESGNKTPFYVDFVIRLKNGKIMLFDTKSPGSEPLTAHLKHNALNAYIVEENAKGANLVGGVIVKDGMNWVWSRYTIENTVDHAGWAYLDFKQENS
jgi:hypothetical protein BACCOPRO_00651